MMEETTSRPRLIWYQLVDSADGQPYKAASATKVSVALDASVDDFRTAVQDKWDKPGYLDLTPAGALLVYKNKAAFDKRNAAKPLKSSAPLHGFGETEDEALIVVVPPSFDVIEPSAKLMRRENFLATLAKEIPAPSSFAKNKKGGWVQFLKDHPGWIISHRDTSEELSIPVCLMNPIFSQFVQDLDQTEISKNDCQFVMELTESMCASFDDEEARMNKFIELFGNYLGCNLLAVCRNRSTTDGSLLRENNRVLYCNLEVKVEKGEGSGDPYMQNIAYYIKHLPTTETSTSTQYPCFLLELCGTAFCVSGILNTDRQVICDVLSPMYQLLRNQDFSMTHKIIKLFASLRKSLMTLSSKETILLPACLFPYLSSFRDRESNLQFQILYLDRVQGLLFSAKRLDTEAHVIVKFCSRYNADVHLYCFRCGFAPALISYTTLGHYKVVVMEKLNNLRALTRDDLKKSEILQQIRAILSKLKEKNYVHGDFRRCNILVDTGSNRVFLVDFDWSGIDGVVKYPPLMNSHITWPEGANTGELIRHEHDVYWLDHFFDDVLPPF